MASETDACSLMCASPFDHFLPAIIYKGCFFFLNSGFGSTGIFTELLSMTQRLLNMSYCISERREDRGKYFCIKKFQFEIKTYNINQM